MLIETCKRSSGSQIISHLRRGPASHVCIPLQGKKEEIFYTIPQYEQWRDGLPEADRKKWKSKYYKGLGTSTAGEAKEYFRDLERNCIDFTWEAGDERWVQLVRWLIESSIATLAGPNPSQHLCLFALTQAKNTDLCMTRDSCGCLCCFPDLFGVALGFRERTAKCSQTLD